MAWVSDTTFDPTREGWLFLAVRLDLFSCQVIGRAMSGNIALVLDTPTAAIWRRGKPAHSDQGSTYASGDYCKQLARYDLICSKARKGKCLDNAVAESFFGSLKNKSVDHEGYGTRQQAKPSIFEYVEVFYNRQRRHANLNDKTPVEFEAVHAGN